jgi:hypothetical protein
MKTVLLFVLLLTGCANGSALVTGKTRPATDPASVQLLTEAPPRYESIGIVTAEGFASFTRQQTQDFALIELKEQAAKIGANAVILKNMNDNNVTNFSYSRFGGLSSSNATRIQMQGEAVFVP